MGWQPPYPAESKIYAKHILENYPDGKIAVLYQNDDYGKDYLDGFVEGLGDNADMIVISEPYEVTDPTIDSQIVAMQNSGADIFFNITTPKFAAQAVRKAYDTGWRPIHFLNNVSSSVEAVLAPAGLDKAVGVISSVYLKDPTDPRWADDEDFKAWTAWMDTYNPDANKADLFNAYAYAAGASLVHVLESAGDELTHANIMKQAASMDHVEIPMLLPGIVLNTGADDFYPIEQMQLVRFNGETWEPIGEVLSAD
jgi:branched-chain amino acid transport system substrate-binding protein